jgi:hypothetical protein
MPPHDDWVFRNDGDVKPMGTVTAQPWSNQRATDRATRAAKARTGRRRRVDPTICERDYTAAELEFMFDVEKYKRTSGRMFPTWSELLEVLKGLGYEKPVVSLTPSQLVRSDPTHSRKQYAVGPNPRSYSP